MLTHGAIIRNAQILFGLQLHFNIKWPDVAPISFSAEANQVQRFAAPCAECSGTLTITNGNAQQSARWLLACKNAPA